MKTIRVAMIRCDSHGAYFAPMMARHDPMKLQRPIPYRPKLPHTWLNGPFHRYFYGNIGNPFEMTAELVEGFEIVKVWDESREVAQALSDVMNSHPRICDSFAQVSDDVDLVFISDCNGDGSDHLELSAPGLRKGIATFIDKPLANTVREMDAILALSKEHHAPVFCASILRHVPSAFRFRTRLAEIGGAEGGSICCRTWGIAGQIHSVSLAQSVFGNGISEVRAMGPGEMGTMHLSWGNRSDRPSGGVVLHHLPRETKAVIMPVTAYGPTGAIIGIDIGPSTFPSGAANILRLVRKMVHTREVDESMNDMIEGIKVINAGRLSLKHGSRAVKLEEAQ